MLLEKNIFLKKSHKWCLGGISIAHCFSPRFRWNENVKKLKKIFFEICCLSLNYVKAEWEGEGVKKLRTSHMWMGLEEAAVGTRASSSSSSSPPSSSSTSSWENEYRVWMSRQSSSPEGLSRGWATKLGCQQLDCVNDVSCFS